jgi:hypothetical protein
LQKVLKDPELLAEAQKAKMPLQYISAAQALDVVNEIMATPKDVADEFGKYIKFGD